MNNNSNIRKLDTTEEKEFYGKLNTGKLVKKGNTKQVQYNNQSGGSDEQGVYQDSTNGEYCVRKIKTINGKTHLLYDYYND